MIIVKFNDQLELSGEMLSMMFVKVLCILPTVASSYQLTLGGIYENQAGEFKTQI